MHKRKAAFDSLLEAGFNEKQSLALVALMPDMEALEHRIALQMSEMKGQGSVDVGFQPDPGPGQI